MKLKEKIDNVVSESKFIASYGGVTITKEKEYETIDYIFNDLLAADISLYKEIIETFLEEIRANDGKLEYFSYSDLEDRSVSNFSEDMYQVDTIDGGNFKNTNKLLALSIIIDQLNEKGLARLKVLSPTYETKDSLMADNKELTFEVDLGLDNGYITGYATRIFYSDTEPIITVVDCNERVRFSNESVVNIAQKAVEYIFENNPTK